MLYFFVNNLLFCVETERMGNLLEAINSTTKTLQSKFKNLTGNIKRVKKDLKANCNPASICSGIDPDSLTTEANFTALPDVTEQLTNIQDINSNNFSKNAEQVS